MSIKGGRHSPPQGEASPLNNDEELPSFQPSREARYELAVK